MLAKAHSLWEDPWQTRHGRLRKGGRYGVPAQRDLAAALAGLSEEDLLRLRAIARLRARSLPGDMSWSDLLQEAMPRALTGARPWPPGVSLLAFLAGVMRSIGDEQWRRHRRQSIMLHELRPDYARATTLPSQSTPMVIASKPTVVVSGAARRLTAHLLWSARGTESLQTRRWSGMDSNFQYAGAVNLIVTHLVLGLLLWVSQGVPILRPTLCLERDGVELLVPCREKNESRSGTGTETVTKMTKVRLEAVVYLPDTDGSKPSPSSRESANRHRLGP